MNRVALNIYLHLFFGIFLIILTWFLNINHSNNEILYFCPENIYFYPGKQTFFERHSYPYYTFFAWIIIFSVLIFIDLVFYKKNLNLVNNIILEISLIWIVSWLIQISLEFIFKLSNFKITLNLLQWYSALFFLIVLLIIKLYGIIHQNNQIIYNDIDLPEEFKGIRRKYGEYLIFVIIDLCLLFSCFYRSYRIFPYIGFLLSRVILFLLWSILSIFFISFSRVHKFNDIERKRKIQILGCFLIIFSHITIIHFIIYFFIANFTPEFHFYYYIC